jgi:response regulator of citrate/malate metabolism
LDRPRDEEREKELEKRDLKKLDGKYLSKNSYAGVDKPALFMDYRFLNNKNTQTYKDMAAAIVKKINVDSVLDTYKREMSEDSVPKDLSFFDSDNIWETFASGEEKNDEEAKSRYILARYYTALEMSKAMNHGVPKVVMNTVKKTKALREQYGENSLFSMLSFAIGKADCVNQQSSIDELNNLIVINQFNVDSIRGMNHGLLYRVMGEREKEGDESAAYCWYVANLAGAVKMTCKVYLDTFDKQKWNGKQMGYSAEFVTEICKMMADKHEKRMMDGWTEMGRRGTLKEYE